QNPPPQRPRPHFRSPSRASCPTPSPEGALRTRSRANARPWAVFPGTDRRRSARRSFLATTRNRSYPSPARDTPRPRRSEAREDEDRRKFSRVVGAVLRAPAILLSPLPPAVRFSLARNFGFVTKTFTQFFDKDGVSGVQESIGLGK
ncbi:hypothetical protein BE221DRAFT_63804, partial [Ostreococcus tauri]